MRVLPCKCGCNSGPDGRRGIAFAHSQSRKQKKNRISKVKQATKSPCKATGAQLVEKARLRRSFPPGLHRFPLAPAGLPGGKRCKETLLRKASESTAHVAGFGIQLGGLRPSEPPGRFFDSLSPCKATGAFWVLKKCGAWDQRPRLWNFVREKRLNNGKTRISVG